MKMDRKDEDSAALPDPAVIRSEGADSARGYVEAELPQESLRPTVEMERVHVTDPRRSPTLHSIDTSTRSGPRNAEQLVMAERGSPTVEALQDRPATKMQQIAIDPELLLEWQARRATESEAPADLTAESEPRRPGRAELKAPPELPPVLVAIQAREDTGDGRGPTPEARARARRKTMAAVGLAGLVAAVIGLRAITGDRPAPPEPEQGGSEPPQRRTDIVR